MDIDEIYKPKIKICGLFREDDIAAVNEAKPDYCGFIIDYPKSHRNVSPAKAYALRQKLSSDIKVVGVFVNAPFKLVAEMLDYGAIDVAQLHGDEDEGYLDTLKSETPDSEIWKVFHIDPRFTPAQAAPVFRESERSLADMVVLDAGFGAGLTFDHDLIGNYKRPYILAGGLNLNNIATVIAELRPYAVDVSSGVETDNLKDPEKVKEFVRLARSVFV